MFPSPTSSARAAQAIWRRSTQTPPRPKQVLGWDAKKTVADMCRDSWNWQTKNPTGY